MLFTSFWLIAIALIILWPFFTAIRKRKKKKQGPPTATDVMIDMLILRVAAILPNEEYARQHSPRWIPIESNGKKVVLRTYAYSTWAHRSERFEEASNKGNVTVQFNGNEIELTLEQKERLSIELAKYHHRCVRLKIANEIARNDNLAVDVIEVLI